MSETVYNHYTNKYVHYTDKYAQYKDKYIHYKDKYVHCEFNENLIKKSYVFVLYGWPFTNLNISSILRKVANIF